MNTPSPAYTHFDSDRVRRKKKFAHHSIPLQEQYIHICKRMFIHEKMQLYLYVIYNIGRYTYTQTHKHLRLHIVTNIYINILLHVYIHKKMQL